MRGARRTILVAAAGVAVGGGILAVALAAWFFISVFDAGPESRAAAARAFDDVRQRFGGAGPIVEIRDDQPVFTRRPSTGGPRPRLRTLHALAWDPDAEVLTRMEMPFWLIRLKEGPFEVDLDTTAEGGRFEVTVDEVERYGPALLLDHEGNDGDLLMVWTD